MAHKARVVTICALSKWIFGEDLRLNKGKEIVRIFWKKKGLVLFTKNIKVESSGAGPQRALNLRLRT